MTPTIRPGRAALLLAALSSSLPVATGLCPSDEYTAVPAVTERFAPPVAEVCARCPRWSTTRGLSGVLDKSMCFCEHTSFNAAAQGVVQCRARGTNVSTTLERMDDATLSRARSEQREVWWVRTDEPVAWETLRKEQGAVNIADLLSRVASGEWGDHLPLSMWWHGMVDDLERWDAAAAEEARLADSQWLSIQRLMPMLEAWAKDPMACAVCAPAACVDCCYRSSPERNCTDRRGAAMPKPGWWRRNTTHNILHRCPKGTQACLGGLNTSCVAGYTGIVCATCSPGFEEQPAKVCDPCPSTAISILTVLIRGLLLIGTTSVLVHFVLKCYPLPPVPLVPPELDDPDYSPDAAVDHPDMLQQIVDADVWSPARARAMVVAIRTLLSFVQMQALIFHLDLPFPPLVRSVMGFMAAASSPTVATAPLQCLLLGAVDATETSTAPAAATDALKAASELAWPLQRIGFTYWWALMGLLLPVIFAAFMLLVRYCAGYSASGHCGRSRKWALRRLEMDRAFAVVVVTQYSAQPFLLTGGLRLIQCTALEEDDDLFVLSSEPALECDLKTRLTALGMTLILGASVPILLGVAAGKAWRGGRIGMDVPSEKRLERRRESLRSEWRSVRGVDATEREIELNLYDAHTQRRYGFFVEGYQAGLIQGWEFVVLLRKLLLILILVALESAGPMLQGLVALWVWFFALLCHWHWQPYTRSQMNRLETLGLITSAMTLLGGVLWAAAEDSETASIADAQEASVEGPAEAYANAADGSGSGYARGAAWLCVLLSHGMLAMHLLGAYCAASGRFVKAKFKVWCEKRRNKREVRRMTAEEQSEAAQLHREQEFIKSGDVSAIPKAPMDPMHITHEKLEANDKTLHTAAVSLERMRHGIEALAVEMSDAGIGRLAMREQLEALSKQVEPVRDATKTLADKSAVLQAAVKAESIKRNMGRVTKGAKRFGLLGRAGLLTGAQESSNKYRLGDAEGTDMQMFELPPLNDTVSLRPDTSVPQVIPSAQRMRVDFGVGKQQDDETGIALSKESLGELNANQQLRSLGLPRPFATSRGRPGEGGSPGLSERSSATYGGAGPLADLTTSRVPV